MRFSRAAATALLAAAACAGCRSGSGGEARDEGAGGGAPVARVRTAALVRREVPEEVEAFGAAAAAPGATRAWSVPYEARVKRVLVTDGASVEAGAALAEVEPSPEAALQLAEAREETAAAGEQKTLLEERMGLKLSTRPDVQQAEQRERAAGIRQRNLERRGEGGGAIRADEAGIVARVDAQAGQVVPPGAPIVETVRRRDVTVRLGVESADAVRVAAGQAVRLVPVAGAPGPEIPGRVARVARAVNRDTRLVDVFVDTGPGNALRLNEYVRATIVTGRHEALVVPREAVLPEQDRAVLFIVEKGRAVRRAVRTGADDGTLVEVSGEGLEAGAAVVVEGAAELEDGMAVEIDGPR